MTLGDRIYSRRLQLNMTQARLAGEVGRTPTCVSYWEADKREPRIGDLLKLSRALLVSADWLIIGEQPATIGGSEKRPRAAVNGRGHGDKEQALTQGPAYSRTACP